ncbi:xanthine dehydrogenase family protein molybdopterin-binding subunit [Sphingomonas sp. BK580]|uniref:xanthine dehydrogenase family protein molybdopterin-binding subunit n=1 Tax=Sphingomonas sp. BK580 TaxID=2586972 RepID=UPI00162207DB|nr:xanthine dehydrogenase family protein molybdopterin-binding subunit [Sphingomonas sp. BK580]MBB3695171.1 xanthine dehydrogenase YagR molybdenum-binding subunit [Sphingomonas sp. BK580]
MPIGALPEIARIDARDKVRGATLYAADHWFDRPLYAMLVPARIAKGTLLGLDTAAALAVPGVVRIVTEQDLPAPPKPLTEASEGPPPAPPTFRKEIGFRGQSIALVLAETLEAAIEGADAVVGRYAAQPFASRIDSDGARREPAEDKKAGDAGAALAQASNKIDQTYVSPTQHHNPIELLATSAVFEGGRLTIYECTQHSAGVRDAVARSIRMDPRQIDVKSPSVGGGFGQKGTPYGHSAIVARAAMLTGRPVKLVIPRGQIFHGASFRPESHHRVRLGADASGKLTAAVYHAEHEQSLNGHFPPADYHEATSRLYDIRDYLGTSADIRIDRQDPGYMRCPHPQPSCFAFESAVDELAVQLGRDPVEFRLANDGRVDPLTGKPYSSRFLSECIREGARRFGWSQRKPEPGSMRLDDGTLVGWGMAVGAYPSMMVPSLATLRIGADGRSRFSASGHEMGQGIKTSIANVLLEGLRIDPDGLEIVVGDTSAAPQHITAGSWGSAGVVPAAAKAVDQMRAALGELLSDRIPVGNVHRQLAAVKRPYVEVQVSSWGPGQDAGVLQRLRQGAYAVAGPEYAGFTTMSYIAHFVEVQIEPRMRRVRMPRAVSIADCGRVISPRTAMSQVYGGVVWGFSATLREATEIDRRYGGYLNCDLADYVVAVNADIGEIEVGLINQPDPLANSMGLKGLGEVVMAGCSAAIVNAIYHATGKRIRHMPVRIEDLL